LVLLAAVLLVLAGCSSGQVHVGRAGVLQPTAPIRTLHVAPDGDDAGPGDVDRPLRTIGRAAELAEPGTEVRVADGTYQGSLVTSQSGTEDQRIAYVAENVGSARIVGAADTPAAWRNTGDYVDIVGFDISGAALDGLVDGGSYVRIVQNRIHGMTEGNCMSTANRNYDMHDIDVIGNVTWNCGNEALDHGIYVSHPRGLVANNTAYGNAGYGIHCWHNCNELTIANNLVFDNDEGGIVVGQGDGPNDGRVKADDFIVTNNIAVDNGGAGIREGGATGRNNVYRNNLLWNNEDDVVELQTGQQSDNVVADPLFVQYNGSGDDDATLDLTPAPGSPTVDGGTELGAPPWAVDGTSRPQGARIDIGPYER
jgi:hypothetical protein